MLHNIIRILVISALAACIAAIIALTAIAFALETFLRHYRVTGATVVTGNRGYWR